MTTYFHRPATETPPARREIFGVDEDLLDVMSSTSVPPRLRPLARRLGVGSALSSPHLLLSDIVNSYDVHSPRLYRNVSGPATAALLGGSVSTEGELEATGVAFGVSGGLVGFVTFAIPAALLVPGGGFYLAYRLYRLLRDAAALRQYARVSRAAPHVAIAVAVSDHEITRDEARLLRDLLRGRVGSPTERHDILELELDPTAKQLAAFEALEALELEPDDWPALLSIAIATAHADDEYSGEERDVISRLRQFTPFDQDEFYQMAGEAESDYVLRCHIGEAMVAACYQIARAKDAELPKDAAPLMDILLCAAVPSDAERAILVDTLERSDGPTAISRKELTRGASRQQPGLFRRVIGERAESVERVKEFGKTMALFLATLEQWRGWVVRDCRRELFEIGESYGLSEKLLRKWIRKSHDNTEEMRRNWIAPRPWQVDDDVKALGSIEAIGTLITATNDTPGRRTFAVTSLAGGRFLFQAADSSWEWRSADVDFDVFCSTTLSMRVEELVVRTDETTFELLTITIEAHESEVRVKRGP